jgi:hypothetical protein
VILLQASVFADDHDVVVTRRMNAGTGVPAITSVEATRAPREDEQTREAQSLPGF